MADMINAGLVAKEPRGRLLVTEVDLVAATQEELAFLRRIRVRYTNQYRRVFTLNFLDGETAIEWKFIIPCITRLPDEE